MMHSVRNMRRSLQRLKDVYKRQALIEQIDDDLIRCTFEEPQRAMTPGQALVFYDGEYVAGGGTIIKR